MLILDKPLSWLSFFFALLTVLAAPWLFGGWEMWWFWPLAGSLFLSVFCFAMRLTVGSLPRTSWRGRGGPAAVALATWGIFLAYTAIRFAGAPVFMDAERSFLLFLTPVLLGVVIVFGFSKIQAKALGALLAVNLLALGVYGIANHYITGSERVMWMPGYPQYILDYRATGSYYCPDHFSGAMELAASIALGILLSRGTRVTWKGFAVVLLAVACWAILLSKSRGGGMAVGVVLCGAALWGFSQWRPGVRWAFRAGAVALGALATLALLYAGGSYVERFRQYPWNQLERWDRYQMVSGAIRAWKSAPVLGIGPGMHQNLWPNVAASPDGDPAKGKWPKYPNNRFHSYEVHSDWTQLLEEYGVVGFALFLFAAGSVLAVLLLGRRAALRRTAMGRPDPGYWRIQSAFFAASALAFHSLGDFNLQMPATTWMLAAIVSLAFAFAMRETLAVPRRSSHRRSPSVDY